MPDEWNSDVSLEIRLQELEAKLDIYKSTLTEIYDQYDQKLEELSLVRRMGDAVRNTQSLESLSRSLLETVAHEVAVDRLVLMLAHQRKGPGNFSIRAAYWADQEIFTFFENTRSIPWSLETLQPIAPSEGLLSPFSVDNASPEFDPLGKPGDQNRALVFLPLMVQSRILGLMVLSRPHNRPFSTEHERMLAIMGDQAGSALSNVILFDDLKKVNQRLVESESRARQVSNYLQRLLETANDAIFTLNNEGVITYANRKAAQWGWRRDEMLGREFLSFLEKPDQFADWPPMSPPPADKMFEAIFFSATGERREVILSTSRVEAECLENDGQSGGKYDTQSSSWMILVSDMTERRYLERQLIHSEKLASIGLLAAGVAHEVGNPLSAISGYAQILVDGVDSEEESNEYLNAIVNQTGRIQKILKELLDYSRPSQGASELIDLSEALPRTMSLLESQKIFSQVNIKYDFDPAESPYLVLMDRDHLAQIVIIIAMNAAQAMKGKGDFSIKLSRKAGWINITFADNGPGVSPDIIPHIFDPFFTTKDPGEGTGLGLSICQRLVEAYQGDIKLESRDGKGSVFSIHLPEKNINMDVEDNNEPA